MSESQKRDALIIASSQQDGQILRTETEAAGWQAIVTNSVGPARKLLQRNSINLLLIDEQNLPEAARQLADLLHEKADNITLLAFLSPDQNPALLAGLEPEEVLDLPPNAQQLRQTLQSLLQKHTPPKSSTILGRSESIREIREIIDQIASTPVSVLLTGESGVGKDLIALSIHQKSARRHAHYLTINCGAIPETLLESELFGHEKGAFTDARSQRQGIFEAADGGTVFLDEIGEMSLSAQIRLLRVLETREITRLGNTQPVKVDVRIIAATNQKLKQAVEQNRFRRDLYYRLKVVEIPVPPLRNRPEDIPLLVTHFIQQYSQENGVPPIDLDEAALKLLQSYRWPGNIRELKNLIERLMVLSVNRKVGTTEIVNHLEELDPSVSFEEPASRLPVHLGKTPEESHRDLLYWAILEVARDNKELKAFLMEGRSNFRSLPIYPANDDASFAAQSTEIEYTESDAQRVGPADVKPLRDVERDHIARALQATSGHRKRAAKLLDMPERTLYRKIQQYNL